ncbi:peptidase S8 [Virgibacillus phasianinus]|uniref:Peptidase S8 n=1 Tax=Virgibacillus phasianinus TaxID=2017483 RepID=A0A220U5X5_9BACI|nr:S8 family serine peptidase [Virgibacillus phasianinus]ASK63529.1 peptidase S8 [Virgibacillus phasianinus]
MNKTSWTKIMSIVLSLVLLFSAMLPMKSSAAKQPSGIKNAEEVLSNLTDAERQSLKKLEAEPGFTIHPDINLTSPDPVQVIIEFKQDPAKVELAKKAMERKKVSLAGAKEKVEKAHQTFKEELKNLNFKKNSKTEKAKVSKEDVQITREYRHAFNGVAITLPGIAVKDLLQIDVVERIWKDNEVRIDLPKVKKIEPKMADSIPQIGVDKLHEEGIKGEGISVGVIDTGIDYNHPDLQEAYAGYRKQEDEDPSAVDPENVKGWDFVNNDANPMETTYQEWKATDQPETHPVTGSSYYTSHGTHVSGTIAGRQDNPVDYAVKGVAPQVDLYSYKVLGPYGMGTTNAILAGIDKAVKDEMDVINLSLGTAVNDPLSPTSVAVNNAMLSGVVTVVAAGNAGPGEKTLGSPGSAALPISVGASDVSVTIPTFTANSEDLSFTDVKLLGKNFSDKLTDFQNQSYPIVYAGLGKSTDFEGKDLKGKIAFIQRGEITFNEKIQNAKKAGAKAVIVYNNEEGQIPFFLGNSTTFIPSFRMSKENGERLKSSLTEETTFTFGTLSNTKTEGDHLADFSSRGPAAQNYDIKPDVVAPGVAIFSTYPEYINDPQAGINYDTAYARISGTSMASPHVAGTAALILQQHPDYTPFDVKSALMNTTEDLQENYSVYEVGAGRINAYNAVHSDVSIKVIDKTKNIERDQVVEIKEETGSIGFGNHFFSKKNEAIEDSRKVVIENNHPEDKTFNIAVEFLQNNENSQNAGENGVELDVPNSVTVSSEQSKEIEPTIYVPAKAEFGIYEGYIHITNKNDGNENYQIPFAIRVTDKGIDYVELARPAVPNEWSYHSFLRPFIPVFFKLKSPMETIDVIVKDGETGEAIGLVGTMDASGIVPGRELMIYQGFQGIVYPFTDDPSDPISDEYVKLPEGDYTFEMIAHDDQGKTYTKDNVVLVDNTPAEITFNDLKPGIHEVDPSMYTDEDGYHALWVHTNVYDSAIDVLNSKGLNYDQSGNLVAYYQNSPFPGVLPVNSEGEMKFGLLPEELKNGPVNLGLMPVDLATNAGKQETFLFIKKGESYGEPIYTKDEVRLGETITMTLTLNNVKDFMSGKFDIDYDDSVYKFTDVKVNDEMQQMIEKKDLNVNIEEPIFEDNFQRTVKIGATLSGNGFKGIDGDVNFLDVTFKVVDDNYYMQNDKLDVKNLTYQKIGETEHTTIPVLAYDTFAFISKHSTVQGYMYPEALLNDQGWLPRLDYAGMGANIYAIGPNGKKYEGSIDDRAYYTFSGLPVSEEPYKIIAEFPGHLDSVLTLKVAENLNGELVGQNLTENLEVNYAGDINGDNVIDILDVMRVVAHYDKKNKKADINQDGIVDEMDIRFIEKNFLRIGPNARDNVKPKEKLGRKGLDDFLKSLGLEPRN